VIFWGVFRVKNHDFMQKNHIFFNFRGGARRECTPWKGQQIRVQFSPTL
jgi:hypothetical protein